VNLNEITNSQYKGWGFPISLVLKELAYVPLRAFQRSIVQRVLATYSMLLSLFFFPIRILGL